MSSSHETLQTMEQDVPHKNPRAMIGVVGFLTLPFFFGQLGLNFIFSNIVIWWLLFAMLIAWVYLVEKRTIASIGWKGLSVKTAMGGVGLGILLFLLFGVLNIAIQAIGLELSQETAQLFANQPWPMLLMVVLRAAVVEEVLYRGYAFERIFEFTGSKLLAVLLPLLVFTLAHLSWGVGHLLFVFIVGGIFAIIYAVKRNLALLIVAHFTVDVFAIMALPLMLGSQ